MKIGVIGSGSFGTALGSLLADKGYDVLVWTRSKDQADGINNEHRNTKHLSTLTLPEKFKASTELEEVVVGKDLILSAAPSHTLSQILPKITSILPDNIPIVSASKGIENDTLRLVSEIFEDLLPPKFHPNLSFLSGPSFAKEIVQRVPTAVAIASKNQFTAKRVQEIFSSPYFRTYWISDVVGAELGGALKNVIAIAAGVSDGMNLGQNPRAALITRGLNEITRLGVKMGADAMTFLGLAGLGDLVLTCCGDLSRNRTVGMKLGQGKKLNQILEEMNEVAEGVKTTKSAYQLAKKLNVEMPITEEVYKMLYEDKEPKEVIKHLMGRDLKKEGIYQ
ncbi:MAG: NAD(P)H-dependent glycerol-3-phosphate dehydrogenase [Leptospiraceae bacterium]|nr:NAD(P)H-dependent glycerol-3-phosphate dehydrogenase [Leptospiraceae bacterium]